MQSRANRLLTVAHIYHTDMRVVSIVSSNARKVFSKLSLQAFPLLCYIKVKSLDRCYPLISKKYAKHTERTSEPSKKYHIDEPVNFSHGAQVKLSVHSNCCGVQCMCGLDTAVSTTDQQFGE